MRRMRDRGTLLQIRDSPLKSGTVGRYACSNVAPVHGHVGVIYERQIHIALQVQSALEIALKVHLEVQSL